MAQGIAGVRRAVTNGAKSIDGRLPLSLRRRARYALKVHRVLHLDPPRTFTEKVNWRMVHDRRELLAFTCDKLAMKEHVSAVAPAGVRVPATYWAGTDVAELADVDLPERWVLKPNHRFGLVEFGRGRADVEALAHRTRRWLEEPRSSRGEWAYSRARRCLLVEEMLGTQPPDDYKFFVFEGEPRLIQYSTDRFTTGHRSRMYSPDWQPVGGTGYEMPDLIPPPARFAEMLDAASVLGKPFDFIRVDLYDVDGEIWFGELTPYPGSGLKRFYPPSLDDELGAAWRLPALTGPGQAASGS